MSVLTRTSAGLFIAVGGLLSVAIRAVADDQAPAGARFTNTPQIEQLTDKKWHMSAEPAIWYVAPAGRLNLPQTSPGAQQAYPAFLENIAMDSPRISPYAEINLTNGPWGITLRAFGFSASEQGFTSFYNGTIGDLNFSVGDQLETSLDFAAAETELHYRFDFETSNKENVLPSLDIVGGARIYSLDWRIEQLTPVSNSIEAEEFFGEPFAGIKARVDLYGDFTVDLQTTFGLWPTGHMAASWDIMLGFQWRPVRNFGVQLGYRQLLFRLTTGSDALEFKFDGSMAGFYGGLVFSF